MSLGAILIPAASLVGGTVLLYVCAIRVHTTKRVQSQMIRLADRLYKEATEANQHEQPTLLKIHNLLIETAALAPGISGGVIVPVRDPNLEESDKVEIVDFLNRNAWVLPYGLSLSLISARLVFHGHPLSFGRAYSAAVANIAMMLFADKDGKVELFRDVKKTQRQVADAVRMRTSDRHDHRDRMIRV